MAHPIEEPGEGYTGQRTAYRAARATGLAYSSRDGETPVVNDGIGVYVQALRQLAPANQQLVTTLIRQLAEREGIDLPLTQAAALTSPGEGVPLWRAELEIAGYSPRTIYLYTRRVEA